MRLRNHLRSYTDLGRQTLNCSANDAYNHQTLQNVQTKKCAYKNKWVNCWTLRSRQRYVNAWTNLV